MPSHVPAPSPCQMPTTMSTPMKPIPRPTMRLGVGRSSEKTSRVAIKVNNGVAPLMIPASAEEIWISPNAKANQGTVATNSAVKNSGFQTDHGGSLVPVAALKISKVSKPSTMRPNATPAGVNDSRPSFMK